MPSIAGDGAPIQRHLNAHPDDGSQELRAMIIDMQCSLTKYVGLHRAHSLEIQQLKDKLSDYEAGSLIPNAVGEGLIEKIRDMMGN